MSKATDLLETISGIWDKRHPQRQSKVFRVFPMGMFMGNHPITQDDLDGEDDDLDGVSNADTFDVGGFDGGGDFGGGDAGGF